ncbi:unnamed protein product [Psylliodes chrysocephalus]|uniref:Biogenesis of lysosome-related organelles complex 1 subunit 6 n=1 Tax=Psylliodes chrysocephalus TaxID=3402493 RepID=A0A9P0D283_9CUCU|nr:unnamed protein product [Psylliodes chrysocephala]
MSTTDDQINPYTQSVNNLSNGLIGVYKPPLLNVQNRLKDLTSKQNKIMSQIHQENLNLVEVQYSPEIQELFKKMNTYHNKLVNIKKDMKQIHERSTKLKKRSEKLQQVKEREKLFKMQTELEIKREIELIGPGPSKSDSVSSL